MIVETIHTCSSLISLPLNGCRNTLKHCLHTDKLYSFHHSLDLSARFSNSWAAARLSVGLVLCVFIIKTSDPSCAFCAQCFHQGWSMRTFLHSYAWEVEVGVEVTGWLYVRKEHLKTDFVFLSEGTLNVPQWSSNQLSVCPTGWAFLSWSTHSWQRQGHCVHDILQHYVCLRLSLNSNTRFSSSSLFTASGQLSLNPTASLVSVTSRSQMSIKTLNRSLKSEALLSVFRVQRSKSPHWFCGVNIWSPAERWSCRQSDCRSNTHSSHFHFVVLNTRFYGLIFFMVCSFVRTVFFFFILATMALNIIFRETFVQKYFTSHYIDRKKQRKHIMKIKQSVRHFAVSGAESELISWQG